MELRVNNRNVLTRPALASLAMHFWIIILWNCNSTSETLSWNQTSLVRVSWSEVLMATVISLDFHLPLKSAAAPLPSCFSNTRSLCSIVAILGSPAPHLQWKLKGDKSSMVWLTRLLNLCRAGLNFTFQVLRIPHFANVWDFKYMTPYSTIALLDSCTGLFHSTLQWVYLILSWALTDYK